MKSNQHTIRRTHRRHTATYLTGNGNSRYAIKIKAGAQLYGPGCCANHLKRKQ